MCYLIVILVKFFTYLTNLSALCDTVYVAQNVNMKRAQALLFWEEGAWMSGGDECK